MCKHEPPQFIFHWFHKYLVESVISVNGRGAEKVPAVFWCRSAVVLYTSLCRGGERRYPGTQHVLTNGPTNKLCSRCVLLLLQRVVAFTCTKSFQVACWVLCCTFTLGAEDAPYYSVLIDPVALNCFPCAVLGSPTATSMSCRSFVSDGVACTVPRVGDRPILATSHNVQEAQLSLCSSVAHIMLLHSTAQALCRPAQTVTAS